jgi:hypothetical protein
MHLGVRFLLSVTAALGLMTGAAAQTNCGPGKACNPGNPGLAVAQDAADDQAARAKKRAVAAWQALEKHFGNAGPAYPNIFAESLPGAQGNVQPNFFWTQSQVVRAALNLATVTNDPRYFHAFNLTAATLTRYLLTRSGTTGYSPLVDAERHNPPPIRWWDDNGVGARVLLQAYAKLHDRRYLQSVLNLWPFFKAGQVPGGGELENEADYGQFISLGAVNSDDETAELLYQFTDAGDPRHADFMRFALANDAAMKQKLRAPDGLFWDALYPNIEVSKFKWYDGAMQNAACAGTLFACKPDRTDLPPPQLLPPSPHICAWLFNNKQGVMIASDVMLYRITNNRGYLESAIRTTNAAMTYYTPDWLWRQPPSSNAEYFVALLHLDHYAHDPRIRAELEGYLDRAWSEGRDPATELFDKGGIGIAHHAQGISSMDQAAFVTLYSLLARPQNELLDVY